MDHILFLDIDGVLNCKKSGTFYGVVKSPEEYAIDEHLWGNLEKFLAKFPSVKVVIHSGWVKVANDPESCWDMDLPAKGFKVKTLMPEVIRRLGDRYIGYTPYIPSSSKYDRIVAWLEQNGFFKDNHAQCLVLDDDNSEYSRIGDLESWGGVYVHFTDTENGLDDMDLINIIEIGETIFK